jgi:hypothetical protein
MQATATATAEPVAREEKADHLREICNDPLNQAIAFIVAWRGLPLMSNMLDRRDGAKRLSAEGDGAAELAHAIASGAPERVVGDLRAKLMRLHRRSERWWASNRNGGRWKAGEFRAAWLENMRDEGVRFDHEDLALPARGSDPELLRTFAADLRRVADSLRAASLEPVEGRRGPKPDAAVLALVVCARGFEVTHRDLATRIVDLFGFSVDSDPFTPGIPAGRRERKAMWTRLRIAEWVQVFDDAARTMNGNRRKRT